MLQQAIRLYQKTYPGGSNDEFEISWKPYFLDQVAPMQSELIQDRMLRRMKDPKQVEAAQTRLKRVGGEVGLQLKFGGYLWSSLLAHQLLYIVGEERGSEMQCKVAEQLFHYQFEREADVSDVDVVVEAGVQGGLRDEDVRRWLASDQGITEMEREERELGAAGIRGVPHFIIGGKEHLDGAVGFSELSEAFVAVRESRE